MAKRKAPENWETKQKKAREKAMGYPAYTPKSERKKKR